MRVHNTFNSSSTLPEIASAKLEQLLRSPATGKLITTQHRQIVAHICGEARESGIPIERLVVILKSVLNQTPHPEDSPETRSELTARLVAVCIEEYYRTDGRPKS